LSVVTWVVGLTGGIGSGKSAAADLFAAHGIAVVDTDAIAHELTAPGGAAMPAIRAGFGDGVVAPTARSTAPRCAPSSSPTPRRRSAWKPSCIR
jgi:dephospho-CoA kinase